MPELEWSLGLRNTTTGKYLTQETFGFALNCNGPSLKKKQIFYLETGANEGKVFIRTHLGRYLNALPDGTWKAELENKDGNCEWSIEPQADGTWALKSAHGYYAHGTGEKLSAYTKELPADGKWCVHLAMHPQVNVRNVMRKRFIHFEDNELHCNELVPWGADALLTFVFFSEVTEGRYGFMACNGQYLNANGRLQDKPDAGCQFLLGFHDDQISLRDQTGNYLACVGGKGVVKCNKDKITKDELFNIQDSEPQFTIQDSRGRYVSVRSSAEVKADQTDVTDAERFQLELVGTSKATFMTVKNQYWSVQGDVVQLTDKADASCHFDLEWKKNRVTLRAGGKVVSVAPNGALKANNKVDDTNDFTFSLINRPQLVLRGQYGFVGLKGASGRVEVNRAAYDVFDLEVKDGAYFIKNPAGGYWAVDGDGLHSNSGSPVPFYFEFIERSKFLIKTEGGDYLEGEQNGGFKGTGKDANKNTLWEY